MVMLRRNTEINNYIKTITEHIKEYCKSNSMESIVRNKNMNNFCGYLSQDKELIKAILVDFANFSCSKFGIDLGLYTQDLEK